MVSATWHQVRGRRLQRSSLVTRAGAERLVEITSAVGGVHAQIQASAELQLGVRVADVTHADIRAALWERRVLVKAWTLRGTLHLHPAEELAVWHAARRAGASTSAQEQLEAWRDPAGVVHPPIGVEHECLRCDRCPHAANEAHSLFGRQHHGGRPYRIGARRCRHRR